MKPPQQIFSHAHPAGVLVHMLSVLLHKLSQSGKAHLLQQGFLAKKHLGPSCWVRQAQALCVLTVCLLLRGW
jgi:hypothetical protein